MSWIDFGAVRERVTLDRAVEMLGWTLTREGLVWRAGPCPLACCKSTRCCGYNLTVGRWRCRACGSYGDVIDLWGLTHGLKVTREAAAELCRAAHVATPYRPRPRALRTEKRTGQGGAGEATPPR